MSALSKDRNTQSRDGVYFEFPVAAGKKIFAGAIVVMNSSGYAEPATAASGKHGLGRAEEYVDNSAGAAGDVKVKVSRGCFGFGNAGNVSLANVGSSAYALDDQTVSSSNAGSAVGTIRDVDASGVWVEF